MILRALCPPSDTLPYVSCLHSQVFLVRIRWIWMPCASFISSDLAPGEGVYMKGPAAYNICEGNRMYILRCIYGHMQAPRYYYMFCREFYQKASLKQLQTYECVFICHVSNIIRQQELTNQDLLIINKFINMDVVPEKMHVYKSCCQPVAAMIILMYVDNNGILLNYEELVYEFQKAVKQDGCINLPRDGKINWFL